ncbi:uncharacterized protein LOC130668317 [Microplitis mediator]|uniref:uncharacterized protein LOC130668317 n=1 Tax=Microplitis mediator TaxID=375433 RepID=UPI00255216AF|nr:uncharacterized protein LOC130668317 [Microplitis mediator]
MNAAIKTSIILLLVTWGQCCSHGNSNKKKIIGHADDLALSSTVVRIMKKIEWPVDGTYVEAREYYGSIIHPRAVITLPHEEMLIKSQEYTAVGGCPQVLNINNNFNLQECQHKSITNSTLIESKNSPSTLILILAEEFTMNNKVNLINLANSDKEINMLNCYAFATTYVFNEDDTSFDKNVLLMAVYKVRHTDETVIMHKDEDGDFVHVDGGESGFESSKLRLRNIRSSPIVCERNDASDDRKLSSYLQIGFLNIDMNLIELVEEKLDLEIEESAKHIYYDVPDINNAVSQLE